MEYLIATRQGISFTIDSANTDMADFMKMLNNQQLIAVNISDFGLNKRNIISIVPKEPLENVGPGVYQLSTSDGATYLVELDEGDSVGLVVQRVNDRTQQFVKIGDVVIQSQNFDFIIEKSAING